jgi:hypothetical protein
MDLLGLLYGLVDEVEISAGRPPAIRLKYDDTAFVSARITPSSTYWKIDLSLTELEVWLKFLTAGSMGMSCVDHIDLSNETPEEDLQFTLAIAAEVRTVK